MGTPCKNVIENGTCFYPKNTQQLFPNDLDLVKLRVESYLGKLLKNEKGEAIGLITLMHDKPIENEQEKIQILNNFLPRLISECDRKNYENQLIFNEIKYKDVFDKFQNLFIRSMLLPNGESIITAKNAPGNFHPGEFASVCGFYKITSEESAKEFQCNGNCS